MAGRAGDAGDAGDAGNLGSVAAGWLYADRVDLPFITEKDVAQQRTGRKHFGENNWDPGWAAWRLLADFGRTNWAAQIDLPPPQHFIEAGRDELKDLEGMALDERADALGEIVSQADGFVSYFMTVLGGKPSTHPASFLVFNMANLVATMVAMHFKGEMNRPRPSQVFPALLPPIEVPGHASYPSGHATQAHLFSRCGKEMLELLPQEQRDSMAIVLCRLARRIARNREIAGVHYQSDSKAGEYLAVETYKVIERLEKFKVAMRRARLEWKGNDDDPAEL